MTKKTGTDLHVSSLCEQSFSEVEILTNMVAIAGRLWKKSKKILYNILHHPNQQLQELA